VWVSFSDFARYTPTYPFAQQSTYSQNLINHKSVSALSRDIIYIFQYLFIQKLFRVEKAPSKRWGSLYVIYLGLTYRSIQQLGYENLKLPHFPLNIKPQNLINCK